MQRFIRKTRGAIAIFLVIIMLPTYVFAGLLVDGARISTAKSTVSGAGELAMNAALSEYDQVLKDVYGLFAMADTADELQDSVSRYFNNTINNTGILEGSDSYTRSFINSIGSMFSTDDVSFDNIIDTQVESFQVLDVPDSSIANPNILERQIVEYMKYRGPVNIGQGILMKIGCLGDTSKQTKVMKAKVEYDKKLDKVQVACEKAYEDIKAYNSLLDASNYKDSNYKTNLQSDLNTAKSSYKEMTQYILAAKAPNLQVEALSVDKDLKKSLNDGLGELSGDDVAKQKYEYMKNALSGDVQMADGENPSSLKETEFVKKVNNMACCAKSTLPEQAAFVKLVYDNKDSLKTVYTKLELYEDCYNGLSDEEKEEVSTEKNLYSDVKNKISTAVSDANGYPQKWKNSAKEKGKHADSLVYTNWYKDIDGIKDALTTSIDSIDDVLKKVKDLENKRKDWKNSLDNLSDGDIKTTMKGDYKNSAKSLSKDAVNDLKEKLKSINTHFDKVKGQLEKYKYYDHKLANADYGSTDYYNTFQGKLTAENFESGTKLQEKADSYINEHYKEGDISSIEVPEVMKIDDQQQFYRYLRSACRDDGEETESKKQAKNKKKALKEIGNNGANETAETVALPDGTVSGEIGSEINEVIKKLASGENASETATISPISDGSNSEEADAAMDNMDAVSRILDGLSGVGATVRDNVYLEEYITEMFSCYTSGKDTNGNAIQPLSMNNHDMTNNAFYGCEAEYVLWGSDNAKQNVTNTKALIFGIRFALNSVYAFTNASMRSTTLSIATAIAGWTGFGVPIVQTVLTLAWSMAETTLDMQMLCDGKPVAIYKSPNTWQLSAQNLLTSASDMLASVTEKAIDDVFEKVNGLASDGIDACNSAISDYTTNTMKGMTETIQAGILTPLQQWAVTIISQTDETLSDENIQASLNEALDDLADTIGGESGMSKEIKEEVLNYIRQNYVSSLVTTVSQCRQQLISDANSTVETVFASVNNSLEQIQTKATNIISTRLDEASNALKEEVSGLLAKDGELSTATKEKVSECINQYNKKLQGISLSENSVDLKKDKTTSGVSLTLTYKEYVKIFTFLFMIHTKSDMLSRTSKLIQANVQKQSEGFNIAKSYTMVAVNATVSIRTTFFDVPVSSGVDAQGKETYDLDFSKIGSNRQTIKYVGCLGY